MWSVIFLCKISHLNLLHEREQAKVYSDKKSTKLHANLHQRIKWHGWVSQDQFAAGAPSLLALGSEWFVAFCEVKKASISIGKAMSEPSELPKKLDGSCE